MERWGHKGALGTCTASVTEEGRDTQVKTQAKWTPSDLGYRAMRGQHLYYRYGYGTDYGFRMKGFARTHRDPTSEDTPSGARLRTSFVAPSNSCKTQ